MAKTIKVILTQGTNADAHFGGNSLSEGTKFAFLNPETFGKTVGTVKVDNRTTEWVQYLKVLRIYEDGTIRPWLLRWDDIGRDSTVLIEGANSKFPHATHAVTKSLRTKPVETLDELGKGHKIISLGKIYAGKRKYGKDEYDTIFLGLDETEETYKETDTTITIGNEPIEIADIKKWFADEETRRNATKEDKKEE